jgi:serine/threonine protein kinase
MLEEESLGRPSWSNIVDSAAAARPSGGGVFCSPPRSCFIDINQLEMRGPLGGGASGVVVEARYFASVADRGGGHVSVAVKQVELEIAPKEKELLGREVRILASLRHPNLVAFIGIAKSRRGVTEDTTDHSSQHPLTSYISVCSIFVSRACVS